SKTTAFDSFKMEEASGDICKEAQFATDHNTAEYHIWPGSTFKPQRCCIVFFLSGTTGLLTPLSLLKWLIRER
ncbi:hypothetical protein NDU88_005889, partial [Pleurodeles waltl]